MIKNFDISDCEDGVKHLIKIQMQFLYVSQWMECLTKHITIV